MIIGISAKISHGKDTVGDMIKKHAESFEIKKYAYKLKQIVALLIGCTVEMLEGQDFKASELESKWWYYEKNGSRVPYETAEHMTSDWTLIRTTPRLFLQLMGTECGRDIMHPDVWLNALFADYRPQCKQCGRQTMQDPGNLCTGPWDCDCMPNWIITDVRFPNEVRAIQRLNGIVIRINRPSITNVSNHPSETSLDTFDGFDHVIENDGSLEELEKKVIVMLNQFKLK